MRQRARERERVLEKQWQLWMLSLLDFLLSIGLLFMLCSLLDFRDGFVVWVDVIIIYVYIYCGFFIYFLFSSRNFVLRWDLSLSLFHLWLFKSGFDLEFQLLQLDFDFDFDFDFDREFFFFLDWNLFILYMRDWRIFSPSASESLPLSDSEKSQHRRISSNCFLG